MRVLVRRFATSMVGGASTRQKGLGNSAWGGGEPAIDNERLASDVGGVLGGEESDGIGDFFGATEPAHGDAFEADFADGFWDGGRHVGFNEAGDYSIDADTFAGEFGSQGLGEREDGAFGGGVGGLAHDADEGGDGGDIYDAAAAGEQHGSAEGLGPTEKAVEVDIDDFRPVFLGGVEKDLVTG